MDREMLLGHLRQAERHVSEGERILGHQRCIIEHLRDGRHSAQLLEAAETLLHTFEEVQSMHVADLNRLRGDLAAHG